MAETTQTPEVGKPFVMAFLAADHLPNYKFMVVIGLPTNSTKNQHVSDRYTNGLNLLGERVTFTWGNSNFGRTHRYRAETSKLYDTMQEAIDEGEKLLRSMYKKKTTNKPKSNLVFVDV